MYSKKHEQQKVKNYTLLVVLVLIVAMFFALTLLKFKVS